MVYWNSCEIYTVIVFVKYHIFSFLSLPRCFLSLHCREFPLERRREILLLLLLSQQSKWENALDCRILNYVDITWEFWSFLLFTLKKSDSVIYWCCRCSNVDSTTSRNMVCSQLAGTWYAPRLLSIWYMGSAAQWNPVLTLKYIYTQWELCRPTPANTGLGKVARRKREWRSGFHWASLYRSELYMIVHVRSRLSGGRSGNWLLLWVSCR